MRFRAPIINHVVTVLHGSWPGKQTFNKQAIPGAQRSLPRIQSRPVLPLDNWSLLSQPELTWICVKNEQANKPPSGPETVGELGTREGGGLRLGRWREGIYSCRGNEGCADSYELRQAHLLYSRSLEVRNGQRGVVEGYSVACTAWSGARIVLLGQTTAAPLEALLKAIRLLSEL